MIGKPKDVIAGHIPPDADTKLTDRLLDDGPAAEATAIVLGPPTADPSRCWRLCLPPARGRPRHFAGFLLLTRRTSRTATPAG